MDELLPGTRYRAVCDRCGERRSIVPSLQLVACGCIAKWWLTADPDRSARALIAEAVGQK